MKQAVILSLSIVYVSLAVAQSAAPSPLDGDAPALELRPEITLDRHLWRPGQPILARFTLFNPTDVEIALEYVAPLEHAEAVRLPDALLFGDAGGEARLVATYEDNRVSEVRKLRAAADVVTRTLRLAPRASLGCEVNLLELNPIFRYTGEHQLAWRPFADRGPTATVTFRVERRSDAILVTDFGKIQFELFYEQAPRNVENFIELTRDGFYNAQTFHRILANFILQGGSPDGTPTGMRPDGKTIPAEFWSYPVQPGTLLMARQPDDPDSASSQFFIAVERLPALDGKYTVVGQAQGDESFDTIRKLAERPTTESGRPLQPVVIRQIVLVPRDLNTERSRISRE